MYEGKGAFCFQCMEEDSGCAIRQLRCQKGEAGLTQLEKKQLAYMEKKAREGRIYLTPAVIYAAANQRRCQRWLADADERLRRAWRADGGAWLNAHPAFLDRFGWEERESAILAAGLLAGAERAADGGTKQLTAMLCSVWGILWERISRLDGLGAAAWEEMTAPWQDSESMSSGMAGVILLMVNLQGKEVCERDRLSRPLQRLRCFCMELMRTSGERRRDRAEDCGDEERMEWLLSHFKNPQKPAYIRERGRIHSEWLEVLHRILEEAGLPLSACETMTLNGREVERILDLMGERRSECQYMSLMMVYAVGRELVRAGRAAAGMRADQA